MRRSPDRTPECGFTLIETLVMLAVTALIATLVIPLSGQGVRDNFRLADRVLLAGDRAVSEAEYRRLLRQAVPPMLLPDGTREDTGLRGISTAVRFPVESEEAGRCAGVAGYAVVRLRVERRTRGGSLVCDGAAGTYRLLEWETGEARFSYSPDGTDWFDTWPARRKNAPDAAAPPLVRMSLRQGRRTRLLWVERAGDPSLSDPALDGDDFGAGRARPTGFSSRLRQSP